MYDEIDEIDDLNIEDMQDIDLLINTPDASLSIYEKSLIANELIRQFINKMAAFESVKITNENGCINIYYEVYPKPLTKGINY